MSNCIICGTPHARLYGNDPAMYCGACAAIRRDAAGSVTQVLPTLYLGDWTAAAGFKGERLCVHEDVPDYAGEFQHVIILDTRPHSPIDRSGARVSMERLEVATAIIAARVELGAPLLVHCRGGVERSPLAVAWYLASRPEYPDLDTAYTYLKGIRPVIADRSSWLPEGWRKVDESNA